MKTEIFLQKGLDSQTVDLPAEAGQETRLFEELM
jgi:hypothetical protein